MRLFHQEGFGRDNIADILRRARVSFDDASLYEAAFREWWIFGAYVVRCTVHGNCGEDMKLRDAILDLFFDELYAGLIKRGADVLEFPELEQLIRDRFQEYDSAYQNHSGAGPMWHLGKTVACHLLAGRGRRTEKHVYLALVIQSQMVVTAEAIKKFWDTVKIRR